MLNKISGLIVGVAIGAIVALTISSAGAEQSSSSARTQYRECFAATVATVSGRELNDGQGPRVKVRVPRGWTVIGSGTYQNTPTITLCR